MRGARKLEDLQGSTRMHLTLEVHSVEALTDLGLEVEEIINPGERLSLQKHQRRAEHCLDQRAHEAQYAENTEFSLDDKGNLVLVDDTGERLYVDKVASTPGTGDAVIRGLRRVVERAETEPSATGWFCGRNA